MGRENFWDSAGRLQWRWNRLVHRPGISALGVESDLTDTWTIYWPNGQKKIESSWISYKAHGVTTHWDRQGKMLRQFRYQDGALLE